MNVGDMYVTAHWCWWRACDGDPHASYYTLATNTLFMKVRDDRCCNHHERTVLLHDGVVNIVGSVEVPLEKCIEVVQ